MFPGEYYPNPYLINHFKMEKRINIIKFERVEFKKPDFDPNPQKSKTNNHAWRMGMFIIFKDNAGVEYSYMPKWQDLKTFNDKSFEIEIINQELCKKYNKVVDNETN